MILLFILILVLSGMLCSFSVLLCLQMIRCMLLCVMVIGMVWLGLVSSSIVVLLLVVVIICFIRFFVLIIVWFMCILLWVFVVSIRCWCIGFRLMFRIGVSCMFRLFCLVMFSSLCSWVLFSVVVCRWVRCVLVISSWLCSLWFLVISWLWLVVLFLIWVLSLFGNLVRVYIGCISILVCVCRCVSQLVWLLSMIRIMVRVRQVSSCRGLLVLFWWEVMGGLVQGGMIGFDWKRCWGCDNVLVL